jgi:arylformamidase
MKLIDLTLPIREHWRWLAKLQAQRTFDDYHFLLQSIELNLHGFTHVDAPLHFLPDGLSIEKVPPDRFMGEAAIVDLSHLGENDAVTAEDLEEKGKHIKPNDIVLLRTDWPLKCDYMSQDFWAKSPYTSLEACEWLVGRKVKAVGYDYPPDYVLRKKLSDPQYQDTPEENTTHHTFFKEGILVIEYLCNLHLITRDRVHFMALPLPIEGAGGSPTRAIAIEE